MILWRENTAEETDVRISIEIASRSAGTTVDKSVATTWEFAFSNSSENWIFHILHHSKDLYYRR